MAAFTTVLFILWVAVGVAVRNDAEKQHIGRPALWGVGVVLFGLLALLPYLFVRHRHNHSMQVAPISS